MRCGICGRPLSNEKSIRRGIGPICYKKHVTTLEDPEMRDPYRERIEKLRLKAHRNYIKNIRKYPLKEGEVRCKNCGRPVVYQEGDGCPDAFCCSPCCPYATISPCPREQRFGSVVDALGKAQAMLEV